MEENDNELPSSSFSECSKISELDGWLASSLMQKAIRRGDTEIAMAASQRLFELRGTSAFNRLMVTAFEDIGVGSEAAIEIMVLGSFGPEARQKAGDTRQAIAQAVLQLSHSPKDRGADYLISSAHGHPSLEGVRERIGRMDIAGRIALATSHACPLAERAVAAWYASGIEWGDEHRIGQGNLNRLLEGFRDVGVSNGLLNATAIAAKRTHEPIVVMVPLLASALAASSPPSVAILPMPQSPLVHGIPLYAFGHHTRLGKQAIRRFVRDCLPVRKVLDRLVPEFRAVSVGEMAVYYADAAPVTPKLIWEQSEALERLGRESDFISAGAPVDAIEEIAGTVLFNLRYLNSIRAGLFLASLK